MKIRFILLLALGIFSLNAYSQDADTTATNPWKFIGVNKATISNTSFSNWNAGGDNALSALFTLDYTLNYKTNTSKWDNRLLAVYGLNKQEANPFKKTDDNIEFTSNYGRNITEHWLYAFELNFKTQFDKGYEKDSLDNEYVSSNFLAPAYLTMSPGFEYKANDKFKVYLSPLASKITFVMDDTLSAKGAFGVDPGKKFRYELGFSVNSNWLYDFNDHFGMEHNLRLFSNFLGKPQNIDVNYSGRFFIKATKFITVDFNIEMIYDDDIKTAVGNKEVANIQLKSVLGAGLTVSI
jgi:hypothetical protein